MKLTYEEIESAALELPFEQKAKLSRVLHAISHVEEESDGTPEEIAQAWKSEIDRRWQDFEAGKSIPIPFDDVFRKARALLLK